jgi:hypothetical protein
VGVDFSEVDSFSRAGPTSNVPETPVKAAKRRRIEAGDQHVIAMVSYSQGFSRCSCSFQAEADRRIRSIPDRQNDLASRMTAHVAQANGTRVRTA